MREEIRKAIHELDRAADEIGNPMLLEAAAAVREGLTALPEEQSEGVISHEWMKRINALLREENGTEAQAIPEWLHTLTEPATRFAAETLPETADGIRKACMSQRNRIRFMLEMKQYIRKLTACLPETERREEEERMMKENELALEGMNHMLALYLQKAAEEHSVNCMEKIRFLERYDMDAKEKQRRTETEDRNRARRELLCDAEKNFQNLYESRRINPVPTGLHICSREERGENNVRRDERIDESDEE